MHSALYRGKRALVFAGLLVLVIMLISCHESKAGATMHAAMGIEGTEWLLVEVSGIPVAPAAGERRPFLRFDAVKKQITGLAGCNNFFGGYKLDGSSLKFGPVGSTRMFCPDLEMGLETEFMKALDILMKQIGFLGEKLHKQGSLLLVLKCLVIKSEVT